MAVTHSTAVRTAVLTTRLAQIGSGAHAVLLDSSSNVLVSFALASTPFTQSGINASLPAQIDAVGIAAGTVASAEIRNSSNTMVERCTTVSTSAGAGVEVLVSTLTVTVDQPCTLLTWNITESA